MRVLCFYSLNPGDHRFTTKSLRQVPTQGPRRTGRRRITRKSLPEPGGVIERRLLDSSARICESRGRRAHAAVPERGAAAAAPTESASGRIGASARRCDGGGHGRTEKGDQRGRHAPPVSCLGGEGRRAPSSGADRRAKSAGSAGGTTIKGPSTSTSSRTSPRSLYAANDGAPDEGAGAPRGVRRRTREAQRRRRRLRTRRRRDRAPGSTDPLQAAGIGRGPPRAAALRRDFGLLRMWRRRRGRRSSRFGAGRRRRAGELRF